MAEVVLWPNAQHSLWSDTWFLFLELQSAKVNQGDHAWLGASRAIAPKVAS
jgi:hypothetical protein